MLSGFLHFNQRNDGIVNLEIAIRRDNRHLFAVGSRENQSIKCLMAK